MKLEDQVVSLKLAKKLKEVGYPQEGLWWWIWFEPMSTDVKYFPECHTSEEDDWELKPAPKEKWRGEPVVAPTVAELGEVLPLAIKNEDVVYYLEGHKIACGWRIDYAWKDKNRLHYVAVDTEANARAKMWLYLKENKLLKESKR
jgi:hypothetical protein